MNNVFNLFRKNPNNTKTWSASHVLDEAQKMIANGNVDDDQYAVVLFCKKSEKDVGLQSIHNVGQTHEVLGFLEYAKLGLFNKVSKGE